MNDQISHITRRDARLANLVSYVGDLEPLGDWDMYESIIFHFVGQMLSNKVAQVLESRLENLCGGKVTPEAIARLSITDLRNIGISTAKSKYIIDFTELVNNGQVNLSQLYELDDDSVIKELTLIKGVGIWTAQMILLFTLHRPNVLPLTDMAFLQGFKWLYGKDEKDYIQRKAKKWSPYCSLASRYIYEVVNRNLLKTNYKNLR